MQIDVQFQLDSGELSGWNQQSSLSSQTQAKPHMMLVPAPPSKVMTQYMDRIRLLSKDTLAVAAAGVTASSQTLAQGHDQQLRAAPTGAAVASSDEDPPSLIDVSIAEVASEFTTPTSADSPSSLAVEPLPSSPPVPSSRKLPVDTMKGLPNLCRAMLQDPQVHEDVEVIPTDMIRTITGALNVWWDQPGIKTIVAMVVADHQRQQQQQQQEHQPTTNGTNIQERRRALDEDLKAVLQLVVSLVAPHRRQRRFRFVLAVPEAYMFTTTDPELLYYYLLARYQANTDRGTIAADTLVRLGIAWGSSPSFGDLVLAVTGNGSPVSPVVAGAGFGGAGSWALHASQGIEETEQAVVVVDSRAGSGGGGVAPSRASLVPLQAMRRDFQSLLFPLTDHLDDPSANDDASSSSLFDDTMQRIRWWCRVRLAAVLLLHSEEHMREVQHGKSGAFFEVLPSDVERLIPIALTPTVSPMTCGLMADALLLSTKLGGHWRGTVWHLLCAALSAPVFERRNHSSLASFWPFSSLVQTLTIGSCSEDARTRQAVASLQVESLRTRPSLSPLLLLSNLVLAGEGSHGTQIVHGMRLVHSHNNGVTLQHALEEGLVDALVEQLRTRMRHCCTVMMRESSESGMSPQMSTSLYGGSSCSFAEGRDDEALAPQQQHIPLSSPSRRRHWVLNAVRYADESVILHVMELLKELVTSSVHTTVNPVLFLLSPRDDRFELASELISWLQTLHPDNRNKSSTVCISKELGASILLFFASCVHHNVRDVAPALTERGLFRLMMDLASSSAVPTLVRLSCIPLMQAFSVPEATQKLLRDYCANGPTPTDPPHSEESSPKKECVFVRLLESLIPAEGAVSNIASAGDGEKKKVHYHPSDSVPSDAFLLAISKEYFALVTTLSSGAYNNSTSNHNNSSRVKGSLLYAVGKKLEELICRCTEAIKAGASLSDPLPSTVPPAAAAGPLQAHMAARSVMLWLCGLHPNVANLGSMLDRPGGGGGMGTATNSITAPPLMIDLEEAHNLGTAIASLVNAACDSHALHHPTSTAPSSEGLLDGEVGVYYFFSPVILVELMSILTPKTLQEISKNFTARVKCIVERLEALLRRQRNADMSSAEWGVFMDVEIAQSSPDSNTTNGGPSVKDRDGVAGLTLFTVSFLAHLLTMCLVINRHRHDQLSAMRERIMKLQCDVYFLLKAQAQPPSVTVSSTEEAVHGGNPQQAAQDTEESGLSDLQGGMRETGEAEETAAPRKMRAWSAEQVALWRQHTELFVELIESYLGDLSTTSSSSNGGNQLSSSNPGSIAGALGCCASLLWQRRVHRVRRPTCPYGTVHLVATVASDEGVEPPSHARAAVTVDNLRGILFATPREQYILQQPVASSAASQYGMVGLGGLEMNHVSTLLESCSYLSNSMFRTSPPPHVALTQLRELQYRLSATESLLRRCTGAVSGQAFARSSSAHLQITTMHLGDICRAISPYSEPQQALLPIRETATKILDSILNIGKVASWNHRMFARDVDRRQPLASVILLFFTWYRDLADRPSSKMTINALEILSQLAKDLVVVPIHSNHQPMSNNNNNNNSSHHTYGDPESPPFRAHFHNFSLPPAGVQFGMARGEQSPSPHLHYAVQNRSPSDFNRFDPFGRRGGPQRPILVDDEQPSRGAVTPGRPERTLPPPPPVAQSPITKLATVLLPFLEFVLVDVPNRSGPFRKTGSATSRGEEKEESFDAQWSAADGTSIFRLASLCVHAIFGRQDRRIELILRVIERVEADPLATHSLLPLLGVCLSQRGSLPLRAALAKQTTLIRWLTGRWKAAIAEARRIDGLGSDPHSTTRSRDARFSLRLGLQRCHESFIKFISVFSWPKAPGAGTAAAGASFGGGTGLNVPICEHYQRGFCWNGDDCSQLHPSTMHSDMIKQLESIDIATVTSIQSRLGRREDSSPFDPSFESAGWGPSQGGLSPSSKSEGGEASADEGWFRGPFGLSMAKPTDVKALQGILKHIVAEASYYYQSPEMSDEACGTQWELLRVERLRNSFQVMRLLAQLLPVLPSTPKLIVDTTIGAAQSVTVDDDRLFQFLSSEEEPSSSLSAGGDQQTESSSPKQTSLTEALQSPPLTLSLDELVQGDLSSTARDRVAMAEILKLALDDPSSNEWLVYSSVVRAATNLLKNEPDCWMKISNRPRMEWACFHSLQRQFQQDLASGKVAANTQFTDLFHSSFAEGGSVSEHVFNVVELLRGASSVINQLPIAANHILQRVLAPVLLDDADVQYQQNNWVWIAPFKAPRGHFSKEKRGYAENILLALLRLRMEGKIRDELFGLLLREVSVLPLVSATALCTKYRTPTQKQKCLTEEQPPTHAGDQEGTTFLIPPAGLSYAIAAAQTSSNFNNSDSSTLGVNCHRTMFLANLCMRAPQRVIGDVFVQLEWLMKGMTTIERVAGEVVLDEPTTDNGTARSELIRNAKRESAISRLLRCVHSLLTIPQLRPAILTELVKEGPIRVIVRLLELFSICSAVSSASSVGESSISTNSNNDLLVIGLWGSCAKRSSVDLLGIVEAITNAPPPSPSPAAQTTPAATATTQMNSTLSTEPSAVLPGSATPSNAHSHSQNSPSALLHHEGIAPREGDGNDHPNSAALQRPFDQTPENSSGDPLHLLAVASTPHEHLHQHPREQQAAGAAAADGLGGPRHHRDDDDFEESDDEDDEEEVVDEDEEHEAPRFHHPDQIGDDDEEEEEDEEDDIVPEDEEYDAQVAEELAAARAAVRQLGGDGATWINHPTILESVAVQLRSNEGIGGQDDEEDEDDEEFDMIMDSDLNQTFELDHQMVPQHNHLEDRRDADAQVPSLLIRDNDGRIFVQHGVHRRHLDGIQAIFGHQHSEIFRVLQEHDASLDIIRHLVEREVDDEVPPFHDLDHGRHFTYVSRHNASLNSQQFDAMAMDLFRSASTQGRMIRHSGGALVGGSGGAGGPGGRGGSASSLPFRHSPYGDTYEGRGTELARSMRPDIPGPYDERAPWAFANRTPSEQRASRVANNRPPMETPPSPPDPDSLFADRADAFDRFIRSHSGNPVPAVQRPQTPPVSDEDQRLIAERSAIRAAFDRDSRHIEELFVGSPSGDGGNQAVAAAAAAVPRSSSEPQTAAAVAAAALDVPPPPPVPSSLPPPSSVARPPPFELSLAVHNAAEEAAESNRRQSTEGNVPRPLSEVPPIPPPPPPPPTTTTDRAPQRPLTPPTPWNGTLDPTMLAELPPEFRQEVVRENLRLLTVAYLHPVDGYETSFHPEFLAALSDELRAELLDWEGEMRAVQASLEEVAAATSSAERPDIPTAAPLTSMVQQNNNNNNSSSNNNNNNNNNNATSPPMEENETVLMLRQLPPDLRREILLDCPLDHLEGQADLIAEAMQVRRQRDESRRLAREAERRQREEAERRERERMEFERERERDRQTQLRLRAGELRHRLEVGAFGEDPIDHLSPFPMPPRRRRTGGAGGHTNPSLLHPPAPTAPWTAPISLLPSKSLLQCLFLSTHATSSASSSAFVHLEKIFSNSSHSYRAARGYLQGIVQFVQQLLQQYEVQQQHKTQSSLTSNNNNNNNSYSRRSILELGTLIQKSMQLVSFLGSRTHFASIALSLYDAPPLSMAALLEGTTGSSPVEDQERVFQGPTEEEADWIRTHPIVALCQAFARNPSALIPTVCKTMVSLVRTLLQTLNTLENNKERVLWEQSFVPLMAAQSFQRLRHARHPQHDLIWFALPGVSACDICGESGSSSTPTFLGFHCESCRFSICRHCAFVTASQELTKAALQRWWCLMFMEPSFVSSLLVVLEQRTCSDTLASQLTKLVDFGLAALSSPHSPTDAPILQIEQRLIQFSATLTRSIRNAIDRLNKEKKRLQLSTLFDQTSTFSGRTGRSESPLPVTHTAADVPVATAITPPSFIPKELITRLLSKLELEADAVSHVCGLFLPYARCGRPQPPVVRQMWHAVQLYLVEVTKILSVYLRQGQTGAAGAATNASTATSSTTPHASPQRVTTQKGGPQVPLPPAVFLLLNGFVQYHLALSGSDTESSRSGVSLSSFAERSETERLLSEAVTGTSKVSEAAVAEARAAQQAARQRQQRLTQSNNNGADSVESTAIDKLPSSVLKFCEANRDTINALVHWDPQLLDGPFKFVCRAPRLIDFDFKLRMFRKTLQQRRSLVANHASLNITVSRATVFADSLKALAGLQERPNELRVKFRDEEGADAGGLTREWLQLMAEEMIKTEYHLFVHSSEGQTYQPNPLSDVNKTHLEYFRMCGIVVGLGVAFNVPMDVHLTRSVYRHMIGAEPCFRDVESVDPDLYRNLEKLLHMNVTPEMGLDFTVTYTRFDRVCEAELLPNGAEIPVTNENKKEFIRLRSAFHMTKQIEAQLTQFLSGFYRMIPRSDAQMFTEQELELLICGMPDIDVEDLRLHTDYCGYHAGSPVIRWFWEIVASMTVEDRANLLQFATGASKVPPGGFANLEASGGHRQRFSISKVDMNVELLPQAHTCFNRIDLPEYPSAEVLREKLMLAITYGSKGFAMV